MIANDYYIKIIKATALSEKNQLAEDTFVLT